VRRAEALTDKRYQLVYFHSQLRYFLMEARHHALHVMPQVVHKPAHWAQVAGMEPAAAK
jgi:hypothetical protein